jgi:hypothetical protein
MPGGRALVFPMTATDRLTPAEAAASVERGIQLHGEARERKEPQEEDGVAAASKQVLWVSRMVRNRAKPDPESTCCRPSLAGHRPHHVVQGHDPDARLAGHAVDQPVVGGDRDLGGGGRTGVP